MSVDLPTGNSATWTLLSAGYAAEGVASTVVLVVEDDMVAVVDPGMVADRGRILDPLAAAGFSPSDVTDVVLSHHHPDHTINAALFQYGCFTCQATPRRTSQLSLRPITASPYVRTPGGARQDPRRIRTRRTGMTCGGHVSAYSPSRTSSCRVTASRSCRQQKRRCERLTRRHRECAARWSAARAQSCA